MHHQQYLLGDIDCSHVCDLDLDCGHEGGGMVILVLVNCNVVADLANGSTRINSQTKLTYLGLMCVTSTFT